MRHTERLLSLLLGAALVLFTACGGEHLAGPDGGSTRLPIPVRHLDTPADPARLTPGEHEATDISGFIPIDRPVILLPEVEDSGGDAVLPFERIEFGGDHYGPLDIVERVLRGRHTFR